MQMFQYATENLLYFAKRCLHVVERIQQAEDESGACVDVLEERHEAVVDGSLHLIAGEPAGNVNTVQQRLWLNVVLARETGNTVGVEAVTSINHRDRVPLEQSIGGNHERVPEHHGVAVQQIEFAGWRIDKPVRQCVVGCQGFFVGNEAGHG